MADETEDHEKDRITRNVFEAQGARVGERKTVPLRLGDRIVGEATVEVTEVGITVVSSDITDPDVQKMLSEPTSEFSFGPMPIFYHKQQGTDTDG